MAANRVVLESCYADWTSTQLTIGNECVQRSWRIKDGLLYAETLLDVVSGTQWLSRPARQPAPTPPCTLPQEDRKVSFACESGPASPVEAPSLQVIMSATGASASLVYHFKIFPASSGITIWLDVQGMVEASTVSSADSTGSELAKDILPTVDLLDTVDLANPHLRLTQVILRDHSDKCNELVLTQSWLMHPNETNLSLQGNLFVIEDTLTQRGLIFLKHAPLPNARPHQDAKDFFANGRAAAYISPKQPPFGPGHPAFPLAYQFGFYGHGTGPSAAAGYPWTILTYSGGSAGMTRALQTHQRQFRPYQEGRDGVFLSNTWGDRAQDSRIDEAFITAEIQAAAKLGVDVVQIDDGWEKGRIADTVRDGVWCGGYYAADEDFWKVDPIRLPNGLAVLVQRARQHGLDMGMWFAPDISDDFARWQRDADVLLDLHRRIGINYFKIDAVKHTSKLGEQNLRRLFDAVIQGSSGRITLDFDITAGIRPGYFGAMDVGPLFIENRYSHFHGYWPHHTLRTLWRLSHFIDPIRLRMELLNNQRNKELYHGDPLAPAAYPPEYLFASMMFCSPLGWFEVSNLPPEYFEQIAPLAAVRKAHRQGIFSGTILPIGQEPTGTGWTGFASIAANSRGGYLLLLREQSSSPCHTYCVPGLIGPTSASDAAVPFHVLAGHGSATISKGQVTVNIPDQMDYLFLRF